MKYKCKFCKVSITPKFKDSVNYNCESCKVWYFTDINEIIFCIWKNQDYYEIKLSYNTKKTAIHYWPADQAVIMSKPLITFSHIVEGLTPINIENKLNTILTFL